MSNDIILKILRDIQARQAADSRRLEIMQQDIRMLRAALNDFAKTNVSSGEIEAIHEDLNRLQHQALEFDARLSNLEMKG